MTEHSLPILRSFEYEATPVVRGYTNRTLYVNVGEPAIAARPVTDRMRETFVGGRGFDLWLLWNAVHDDTHWDDPENEIVISSGPCGGITQYPGSGKSIAATGVSILARLVKKARSFSLSPNCLIMKVLITLDELSKASSMVISSAT